jgi:hypothetical protein
MTLENTNRRPYTQRTRKNLVAGVAAVAALATLPTLAGIAHAAPEPQRPRALVVLDASGSMLGQVDGEPKIDAARQALKQVVAATPEDVDLGLMAYGHRRKDDCGDIETVVPIGADRARIGQAVDGLRPRGKTPLTDSIRHAARDLRTSEASASIVVVSDGKETCEGDPCAAAREAAASGVDVRVHVVGFDVTGEEAAQLRCIAENGNGRYFPAKDADELARALEQATAPAPAPSRVLFHDRFEGSALGEAWEVRNPDADRAGMSDGSRVIVSRFPDPDKGFANLHLIRQPLEGDWDAVLAFRTRPTSQNWPVLLYQWDDGSSVRVQFTKMGTLPYVQFSKIMNGEFNQGTRFAYGGTQIETWYFRLEKRGVGFSAYVSNDRASWAKIGEHAVLKTGGQLGMVAFKESAGAAETPVFFDELRVESAPATVASRDR